jgi:hypothetical protein
MSIEEIKQLLGEIETELTVQRGLGSSIVLIAGMGTFQKQSGSDAPSLPYL